MPQSSWCHSSPTLGFDHFSNNITILDSADSESLLANEQLGCAAHACACACACACCLSWCVGLKDEQAAVVGRVGPIYIKVSRGWPKGWPTPDTSGITVVSVVTRVSTLPPSTSKPKPNPGKSEMLLVLAFSGDYRPTSSKVTYAGHQGRLVSNAKRALPQALTPRDPLLAKYKP